MDEVDDDWIWVESVHKRGSTEVSADTPVSGSQDPLLGSNQLQLKQQTILCRFISGAVVKEEVDFRNVEYIAFSHVWGDTEWTNIEGIGDDLPVSKSKRDFLQQHLQSLVGDTYFWIDILCVDQRSTESKIKATVIIPEIYSRALKTIVIRDGRGFKTCCATAFGALSAWGEQYRTGVQQWADHWRSNHRREVLYEGTLRRLWPLQEIMLSNTVKFVTCAESKETRSFDIDFYKDDSINSAAVDSLWSLARAWISYGKIEPTSRDQLRFMHALLNNEQVSRDVVGRSSFSTGIGREFAIQSNSIRKTTQPRDLVLSTITQYDWYTAPSPQWIREQPFGVLYRDCFSQARAANRAVLPKITGGMVGETSGPIETSHVPHPVCLGDFTKLFGLASEGAPRDEDDCALGMDLWPVTVQTIDTGNVRTILQILEDSFKFSTYAWNLARKGELSEGGAWPDDTQFRTDLDDKTARVNATKLLHLMVVGFLDNGGARMDSISFNRDLIQANPSNYARILIRLAALISCGIGISAYEWSEKVLSPVLVPMGQHKLLGLISSREKIGEGLHHLAHPFSSSMQLTYRHFVITRPGEGLKPRHRCVGLMPELYSDDHTLNTWETRYQELGFPTMKWAGATVNLS